MAKEQMTQEDFAIVKLAAAERYRERNIRPETASYLFDRKLRKQASGCGGGGSNKPMAKKPMAKKPAAKPAPVAKQPEVKAAAAKPKMDKIIKLASSLKKVIPAKKA